MRVFVTGASGHIASAVIPELIGAGHQVLGLARSDDSAAAVEALGAEVRRGDLDDPQGVAEAARESDGVIHLAFKHEAMRSGDFASAVDADLAVVQAIGSALTGSEAPFVNTGGTLALSAIAGRSSTEEDVIPGGPRTEATDTTIALAQSGVRSSVVRLPPLVHSDLDHHGFAPTLIALAREKGHAAYIGDGANRWPAVHTRDAALLYRLAVESAPAGSYLHPVGDEGVPFREISETIGSRLGVPAVSVTAEEAPEHLSYLAGFASFDNPTSSELTRRLLGWEPTHPGLIADLEEEHYFNQ
jgi:nucleoside-diphosphate-sugar epimerase